MRRKKMLGQIGVDGSDDSNYPSSHLHEYTIVKSKIGNYCYYESICHKTGESVFLRHGDLHVKINISQIFGKTCNRSKRHVIICETNFIMEKMAGGYYKFQGCWVSVADAITFAKHIGNYKGHVKAICDRGEYIENERRSITQVPLIGDVSYMHFIPYTYTLY